MEPQYQHTVNGQSVIQEDLNVIGETAGLADDRVLAELFRLEPFDGSNVRRGILPYGDDARGTLGLLAPNGASGSVLVYPFRAIVGSRTAVASDAKANWRDVRSAIGVGTSTLAQTVSLTANASGNPRWDLIYAAVAVDAASASEARKVKDPTSKVIASQNVVKWLVTSVALGVVEGTAAASPDWPTPPADAGDTYYVPLGYVRVPDGFGAASTVLATDIATTAPVIAVSDATGATSVEFADTHRNLSASAIQAWGATGTKPKMFIPSTAVGSRTLVVAVDLTSGTESHAHGAVLDARDWRGRICKWRVHLSSSGVVDFAWDEQGPRANFAPKPDTYYEKEVTITDNAVIQGWGHTLRSQSGPLDPYVAWIVPADQTSLAAAVFGIYCDMSTGELKLTRPAASPNIQAIFWIEFSGRIENT